MRSQTSVRAKTPQNFSHAIFAVSSSALLLHPLSWPPLVMLALAPPGGCGSRHTRREKVTALTHFSVGNLTFTQIVCRLRDFLLSERIPKMSELDPGFYLLQWGFFFRFIFKMSEKLLMKQICFLCLGNRVKWELYSPAGR